MLQQNWFNAGKDLADLDTETRAIYMQENIWRAHIQFLKEQSAKTVVVILTSMYEDVLAVFIQQLND